MREYKQAAVKLNSGGGALLCTGCSTIVSYGSDHVDMRHYCEDCFDDQLRVAAELRKQLKNARGLLDES